VPAKDYYQVLGVPEDADESAIKKTYRKLARRYHPDANPDDPSAEERFKEISEAYQVLSDPEKRRQYDRMRKAGAGAYGFGGGRGAPSGATGGWQTIDLEDLGDLGGSFGGGSFSDLFASIFGQRARGQRSSAPKPQRGADRQVDVRVSFEIAARGGQITVTVPLEETCPRCDGTGAEPGTPVETCPQCGGTGQVSLIQGGFAVQRPCPRCFGRGTLVETPCGECRGEGSVARRKKIRVRIPAGTEDGDRIRLRGKGEPGTAGAPPGDLFLTVRVKPDRFFRRDGLDVTCRVPINIAQAMLGTKVRVRTIQGGKVEVKVPAGTQSGTMLRLKGQGIRKDGEVGDQYVEIEITVPDASQLSDEERALVEELAHKGSGSK